MKKIIVIILIGTIVFITSNTTASAKTINETETDLCDTLKLALMNSLREPIDKAIEEIYKNDKNAPKGLRWDATSAELLKIKQVYGIGGLYEITVKIEPFYQAHISYGVDEIVVNTEGDLIKYKYLKTYY